MNIINQLKIDNNNNILDIDENKNILYILIDEYNNIITKIENLNEIIYEDIEKFINIIVNQDKINIYEYYNFNIISYLMKYKYIKLLDVIYNKINKLTIKKDIYYIKYIIKYNLLDELEKICQNYFDKTNIISYDNFDIFKSLDIYYHEYNKINDYNDDKKIKIQEIEDSFYNKILDITNTNIKHRLEELVLTNILENKLYNDLEYLIDEYEITSLSLHNLIINTDNYDILYDILSINKSLFIKILKKINNILQDNDYLIKIELLYNNKYYIAAGTFGDIDIDEKIYDSNNNKLIKQIDHKKLIKLTIMNNFNKLDKLIIIFNDKIIYEILDEVNDSIYICLIKYLNYNNYDVNQMNNLIKIINKFCKDDYWIFLYNFIRDIIKLDNNILYDATGTFGDNNQNIIKFINYEKNNIKYKIINCVDAEYIEDIKILDITFNVDEIKKLSSNYYKKENRNMETIIDIYNNLNNEMKDIFFDEIFIYISYNNDIKLLDELYKKHNKWSNDVLEILLYNNHSNNINDIFDYLLNNNVDITMDTINIILNLNKNENGNYYYQYYFNICLNKFNDTDIQKILLDNDNNNIYKLNIDHYSLKYDNEDIGVLILNNNFIIANIIDKKYYKNNKKMILNICYYIIDLILYNQKYIKSKKCLYFEDEDKYNIDKIYLSYKNFILDIRNNIKCELLEKFIQNYYIYVDNYIKKINLNICDNLFKFIIIDYLFDKKMFYKILDMK